MPFAQQGATAQQKVQSLVPQAVRQLATAPHTKPVPELTPAPWPAAFGPAPAGGGQRDRRPFGAGRRARS